MPTAIKFENISKQYRLGLVSTQTLSHDLNRWWKMNIQGKEDPYLKIGDVNDRSTKGTSDYVWALKDINFEVQQGDVLGIIGKNGAGKSTLLKILSKVTAPTTGSIQARGRIASLLEVGTGFHPEMTGRENIYMNGAIMGMTKAEITRKLDEIIDFSGVERYIDTPAKRYSSGMTVRLGFAIAAYLEPEILVVDEVLAVGDAEFQKKAIGKMQDVSRGEGRTVLFVSHNMQAISTLTHKCVLLNNGSVDFLGKTDEVIKRYLELNSITANLLYVNSVLNPQKPLIRKIELITSQPNNLQINGDNFNVEVTIELPHDIKKTCFTMALIDEREIPCLDFSYFDDENKCSKKGVYKLICNFPKFRLYKGSYSITYYLAEPPGGEFFETKQNVCSFHVEMFKRSRGDWEWQDHSTTYLEEYNWQILNINQ